MYSIETSQLTKRYKDVTAVDGLDMKVLDGEIFSLLGVNGAGKTTAIRMLSSLTQPTSGTARVGGHDLINDSEEIKKIIAISPQETAVAPGLSVKENLELIAGLFGFAREQRDEKDTRAFRDLRPFIRARQKSGQALRRMAKTPQHRDGSYKRAEDTLSRRADTRP